MFQTFDAPSRPEQGPPRLAALRTVLRQEGLHGFIVPRTDMYQGEYVAPCDERLAWLTGFTGSAGFCAVLEHVAGVFIDGRYRVQVTQQVDPDAFTPVPWPETKLGPWLVEHLPHGGKVGFDPWLHTQSEIEAVQSAIETRGIELIAVDNLIDRIWTDRPAAPRGKVSAYPIEYAGETAEEKCARLAENVMRKGIRSTIITLPDSICWLLNIRGSDIARNPVAQGFAILHSDGRVALFMDPEKTAEINDHFGPLVSQYPLDAFSAGMMSLTGTVALDPKTAPWEITRLLRDADVEILQYDDPCILPKAIKNEVEINGTRTAHTRDAVAMVQFLAWVDQTAPSGTLTEIDVVKKLEAFRSGSNGLREISFDTISGAGPNGAVVHYRVSEDSNRTITPGDLLLVDSGGQYLDGTTDITRTLATGAVTDDQKACFTRVLQGMIAISRLRFPRGLAGRDIDAIARYPLWLDGRDYDHGTGHGVGVYLSVHEGPQRLARTGEVALEPGMILSNEPGYYRNGDFGIRLENLIVVQDAPALGDNRDQLSFETLTWVPFDTRLIDLELISKAEKDWLNDYHAEVLNLNGPRLDDDTLSWLRHACAPI